MPAPARRSRRPCRLRACATCTTGARHACCATSASARRARSSSPPARCKGEEEHVLEAFQRIRATLTTALLIIAPRKPERFDDVERLVHRAGWKGRAPHGAARRCRTAPRRRHPRHDGRAGAALSGRDRRLRRRQPPSMLGATISSNRPSSGSQSSLVRTWTTSPRSRCTFLDNGAAIQVRFGRQLERTLLELPGRSRAPRQPGRSRARARRGQPRRARIRPSP